MLDPVITDLHMYYHDAVCVPPLDVDPGMDGVPSDHLMVVMTPLDSVDNVKRRTTKKIQVRPLHSNGFEKMELLLRNHDWNFVNGPGSVNELMEMFQNNVFNMFDSCFPSRTKVVASDDQPYWNEELTALKRKACREYHKNRASNKYLNLHSQRHTW